MIEPHLKKYLRLISYVFTSVAVIFVTSYIVKNVKNKTAEYKTTMPSLISKASADLPYPTPALGDGDGGGGGGGDDCDSE